MAYLNVDINYFDNVKTKRLILKLGQDGELIPLKLWSFAAKFFQVDGVFKDMTGEEIVLMSGIRTAHDSATIMKALVDVGFIEKTDKGYKVHDWEDNQGHLVSFKIRARDAARARWSKLRQSSNKNRVEVLTGDEITKAWED